MDKKNFNKVRQQLNQQKHFLLMIQIPKANQYDVIQLNKSALLGEIKEEVAKYTTTNYKEVSAVVVIEAPILNGETLFRHRKELDLEKEFLYQLRSKPEVMFKLQLVNSEPKPVLPHDEG